MAYRTPNIRLQLEPRVIRSIIESSGMDHSTIAQKMKVDKARVDGWARTGVIEYPKVRALAKCVKRSETLFLRTVPLESEELPDYRMMPGAPERLDAGDLPKVRRVRYMQSAAREMMDVGGTSAEPQIPTGITVGSPADGVAAAERARLAVECRADGTLRGSPDEIYRRLRAAIEGTNILVFQYPLTTMGVRGLTLASPAPCAILVNSSEIATAKSFTLLHEYGHALLGRGGVCDEHGMVRPNSDKKRVETWCNRFAASFLMPESPFAAEMSMLEARLDNPFRIAEELAEKFKTSRFAAMSRAAGLSGGAGPGYGGALGSIAGSYSRRQKAVDDDDDEDEDRDDARPRYLDILVSRLGKKFIRLVLSSHEHGIITTHDLGDYLGMRLKHLDKLLEKVPPDV